jgi:hypothetical protein
MQYHVMPTTNDVILAIKHLATQHQQEQQPSLHTRSLALIHHHHHHNPHFDSVTTSNGASGAAGAAGASSSRRCWVLQQQQQHQQHQHQHFQSHHTLPLSPQVSTIQPI